MLPVIVTGALSAGVAAQTCERRIVTPRFFVVPPLVKSTLQSQTARDQNAHAFIAHAYGPSGFAEYIMRTYVRARVERASVGTCGAHTHTFPQDNTAWPVCRSVSLVFNGFRSPGIGLPGPHDDRSRCAYVGQSACV